MKYIKKITREVEIVESMECDMCHITVQGSDWNSIPIDNTEDSHYESNETEIKLQQRVTMIQREGVNYPDGGWGTVTSFDICPTCFKEKVIPWLESQGVKVDRKDWDW